MKLQSVVVATLLSTALADFGELFKLQNPLLGNNDDASITDNKKVPGDSPIELCDTDISMLLKIEYINIEPNPPLKGNNLTISASGNLSKTIEQGAYVDIDVKYGYIRLLKQTLDLCEQTTNVELDCPIEEGKQTVIKEVALPNEIPPGKYMVTARAYTKDDDPITCLYAEVEFSP